MNYKIYPEDIMTYLIKRINIIYPTNCWEWKGGKNKQGYGLLKYENKNWSSHRLSYHVFNQKIPDNMIVCHKCDNPTCINPSHLFIGTYKDNMEDMYNKGRGFKSKKAPQLLGPKIPIQFRRLKGEDSPLSKLCDEQVVTIIKLLKAGCRGVDVAKEFKVHISTISLIKNGKRWKHLTY